MRTLDPNPNTWGHCLIHPDLATRMRDLTDQRPDGDTLAAMLGVDDLDAVRQAWDSREGAS